jgi:hypothetical protein
MNVYLKVCALQIREQDMAIEHTLTGERPKLAKDTPHDVTDARGRSLVSTYAVYAYSMTTAEAKWDDWYKANKHKYLSNGGNDMAFYMSIARCVRRGFGSHAAAQRVVTDKVRKNPDSGVWYIIVEQLGWLVTECSERVRKQIEVNGGI